MTDETKLNAKEQRLMRRWFKKTDENTIELKEKRWAGIKIILGIILLAGIYYNFIDTRYINMTWNHIDAAFRPDVWAERAYAKVASFENPGFTRWGDAKEVYLESIDYVKEYEAWWGYVTVGKYILFFIFCLWPTKRRVRFDRKQGIIYTYINKKFYLTEVNKLMRPFPEYFAFMGGMLCFWVHPHKQPPKILCAFRQGSQMIVSDYTMWLPMIFMWIPGMYQRSKGAALKRFLVDFMNPNTPPERIASMMQALENRPSIFEYLERWLFGWIDGGLFCRKLPKDSQLEAEIENYFAKDAPHITALPSFEMGSYEENVTCPLQFQYMKIISVEENVQWGYGIMPCPNLYEYPMRSLHYNRFDMAWGNEKEMERDFASEPTSKKRKKKQL